VVVALVGEGIKTREWTTWTFLSVHESVHVQLERR
jgi:hypothetical protein